MTTAAAEQYGSFTIPMRTKPAPVAGEITLSGEAVKAIEKREELDQEVLNLWLELRYLRKEIGDPRAALDDKINKWFEVKYGLDSLTFESFPKVINSLKKAVEMERKKTKK